MSTSSSDTKSNDNENIQTNNNELTKQNDSEEINSDLSQIKQHTTNISDISGNRQHLKQQQQNDQQKQSSILINGKRYYRNYIY